MSLKDSLRKFWNFLKEDSWQSWIVSLVLLIILIRFVLFPTLSFITSSPLPLVVVESCSMYHESSFDKWWAQNFAWYENRNISNSQFKSFSFKNGLNKGDIIFVWGRSNYNLGDVIIFAPNSDSSALHPIIHRIISKTPLGTKGDHNLAQLTLNNNDKGIDETSISKENILGKAVFKIPLLGWIKLAFFEPFRDPDQRGLC